MKKYIVLTVICIFLFGALTVFYVKSESILTKEHQNILKLFLTAKQLEATLEKDLLKSRNFLLLTYDPLVENEGEVEQICQNLKNEHLGLYNRIDDQLDNAIEAYCVSLEQKMEKVERFKSKNAILRNSIYFLQKLAADDNPLAPQNKLEHIESVIIKQSLAYALASTPEAKESLSKVLTGWKKIKFLSVKERQDLESVVSHAERIYEVKEVLDTLTNEIVNSDSSNRLENLRQSYFTSYVKSESTATVYRKILFGVCISFLFFVIYNITLLWKAARNLSSANENLESRVIERTKELKESQEKIIQQQQALVASAKMSSLGEMASGIAHEINTPLAVIAMRAEQLEECIEDGSLEKVDILNGLSIIKVTTARIAKIISGLRFFARDGKGLPTALVPISSIIEETLSFCRERFENHGVHIEVIQSESNQLEIDCRSVEISQVLLNLLNNAYDAIEHLNEKKWVRIEVQDRNENVEISVIDCGLGIPKEIQEKIMQPFFTTKDVGKGTGLGLSIARGVIQSHNGKLYINSESRNTCFTILLPKKPSLLKEA